MQHPLLLVFLTMAHRHVPCSFDKLSLNDTTDRLLRRQSKTRVKRFKSANKNKNIAITGFTHLMKAHKHKQTLDLDLLWIIFLSGKFGLMYVCWRNVTAPYLHWLYHSIPWSQVSPPNHIWCHMTWKKQCKSSLSLSYLVTCTASCLLSTPSSLTQVEVATSLPPATSCILTFSVTIASWLSFASSSWPGAACLIDRRRFSSHYNFGLKPLPAPSFSSHFFSGTPPCSGPGLARTLTPTITTVSLDQLIAYQIAAQKNSSMCLH